jgi:hypothetical protein
MSNRRPAVQRDWTTAIQNVKRNETPAAAPHAGACGAGEREPPLDRLSEELVDSGALWRLNVCVALRRPGAASDTSATDSLIAHVCACNV